MARVKLPLASRIRAAARLRLANRPSKGAKVASNYEAIYEENRRRYGTDIGRIGPMLLADRYDDRTHFIFELLQNAEDALGRRGDWNGHRKVTFTLEPGKLALSHFGQPFDEADVRGICGIAESTKGKFSIGRFGIGFKSVYTFTNRPEIHSGGECFAIQDYVQPTSANRVERQQDETLIVLPLKAGDSTAQDEIIDGFKRLGPNALLFLRHIEEISWNVRGGASGVYLRSTPELLDENVHRITVIGLESGQPEVDQNWLVFHRDVFSPEGDKVGRVEVAFALQQAKDPPDRSTVVPVATSPLVVFFPTAVETNLGFFVQGPYRTTPSRDNIPRHDSWNKYLVEETSGLLVEALRWLRDQSMLDTAALRCLPLDREKFPDSSMFAPMFGAVREALLEEPLLPRFDGGYISASRARLARTQDLRELFSPQQVAQLFGGEVSAWLTGDITPDRTPEIRQYVMRELGVTEVTPTTIVPRLTREFLEAQSDDWILLLYEFLGGQEAALRRRLDTVPLVRLADGRHVVAREGGKPQAFLPSNIETGFPTVHRSVCATQEARLFLISLGITAPDPVDDVIWNVLPKYQGSEVDVNDDQYARDISRILTAFSADSNTQKEKLLAALRETSFLMVVDTGDGKEYVGKPGDIYLATDRLQQLFSGVSNVMIVDGGYDCLRGEGVRLLLEACGAVRYPRPIEAPEALTHLERQQLRREAGHEVTSGHNDQVVDWVLQGFEELIGILPSLSIEQRTERARLLWESLGDLEERRGRGIFEGSYKWSHYGSYRKDFPANFLRRLNEVAWVPDADGELQPPCLVIFDNLGWKANPFLLTKIVFKPPIIDQLAKEAGIDPAALDLLRKLGITSVADLTSRLGIVEPTEEPDDASSELEPNVEPPTEDDGDVYDDAKDLYGDDMPDIQPGSHDPNGGDEAVTGGSGGGGMGQTGSGGTSKGGGQGGEGSHGGSGRTGAGGSKGGGSPGKRSPGSGGGRPFISYVGTHPDEEEPDPDGLDQATRMRIEGYAIDLILKLEPTLRRTPEGNPGYDLYECDATGKPVRWVEVKSMTGSLEDRPVGLSRTQFDYARERGAAFWLYVVEHATDADVRILRIQNPVAHARTFTFDRGWIEIAQMDP